MRLTGRSLGVVRRSVPAKVARWVRVMAMTCGA
jgi:hypothetical protein